MNVVESQCYSFGFWCWSPEHRPAWRVSRSGAFPGSSALGSAAGRGRCASGLAALLGGDGAKGALVPRLCVQRCFTGVRCVSPASRGARRQDEPGSCLEEEAQQARDAPPSGAASQLLEQRKEGDGYGMGSASSSSHPTPSWELGCWIPTFPALHSSLRSLVPLSLQFPMEDRAPFLSWLVTRKANPLGTSQCHSCKDQG